MTASGDTAFTGTYGPPRIRNDSDAASVGAWPDGIVGSQLGPNSNGKPTS